MAKRRRSRKRPRVCIKHAGKVICGRKVKMPKGRKGKKGRRR